MKLTNEEQKTYKTYGNVLWRFFAGASIFVGLAILYHVLVKAGNGYHIPRESEIPDLEKTGQFGDFVGGVIGTFFSLAGVFLLYLTLNKQTASFSRERFENNFFELLKLHRDNVAEMSYTKHNSQSGVFSQSKNRKVFRVIYREFTECYKELKAYTSTEDLNSLLTDSYKADLNNIKNSINDDLDIIELALIDITYSIIFFGVGQEGAAILKNRFEGKYNSDFTNGVIRYFQCKPKKENVSDFNSWEQLQNYSYQYLQEIIKGVLTADTIDENVEEDYFNSVGSFIYRLFLIKNKYKYYDGHQHRLGHYFRHLFQCYKFINSNNSLLEEEKYYYGKTLRAQLSTYEQVLLFINSVSTLGMKWELLPEDDKNESRMITFYHLIKNVAGDNIEGIKYADYYPNVNYEADE
ncbi:MAG: putative phage abortive infection protein [Flavipsychrobacter sp.]